MALVDVNPVLAERWRQFVDSISETGEAPNLAVGIKDSALAIGSGASTRDNGIAPIERQ